MPARRLRQTPPPESVERTEAAAPAGQDRRAGAADEVEALMVTSKVVAAAIAHSIAATGASVTLAQLRVLVMVDDAGRLNMAAVADGLGVNPSNASRTCDRLVRNGLLDRREDPDDRRNVALTLTPAGGRLVAAMLGHRRAAFTRIVEQLDDPERAALAAGLAAFNAAARSAAGGAGVPAGEDHLLGWLT